ncbi:MAG: hypothetical protein J6Z05_11215 [Lachnospiraceae bacterium]|nr:hypothetical protein [Lachnospiraceae bacterium]
MKKMSIPASKKAERLYKEIRAFRLWADKNYPNRSEENDNGEWEFGVNSHFNEMLSTAILIASETDIAEADEKLIDALLFVVARDNESEILADELLKHKDWFELLARKSPDTQYINAQWQFAKRLAGCDPCKDLIFVFIESEDEYTSRMALETMAKIDQKKAEEYAVRFWNRGKYPEGSYEDEYQKIMVLHVLNTVGSGKLNDYLKESLNMPYKWLKENAEEILNNETKEVGNET